MFLWYCEKQKSQHYSIIYFLLFHTGLWTFLHANTNKLFLDKNGLLQYFKFNSIVRRRPLLKKKFWPTVPCCPLIGVGFPSFPSLALAGVGVLDNLHRPHEITGAVIKNTKYCVFACHSHVQTSLNSIQPSKSIKLFWSLIVMYLFVNLYFWS